MSSEREGVNDGIEVKGIVKVVGLIVYGYSDEINCVWLEWSD
jgi:hypothetical protein